MSGSEIAAGNSNATLAASGTAIYIFIFAIDSLTDVWSICVEFVNEALNVIGHPFGITLTASIENTSHSISSQKERATSGWHSSSFCPLWLLISSFCFHYIQRRALATNLCIMFVIIFKLLNIIIYFHFIFLNLRQLTVGKRISKKRHVTPRISLFRLPTAGLAEPEVRCDRTSEIVDRSPISWTTHRTLRSRVEFH